MANIKEFITTGAILVAGAVCLGGTYFAWTQLNKKSEDKSAAICAAANETILSNTTLSANQIIIILKNGKKDTIDCPPPQPREPVVGDTLTQLGVAATRILEAAGEYEIKHVRSIHIISNNGETFRL